MPETIPKTAPKPHQKSLFLEMVHPQKSCDLLFQQQHQKIVPYQKMYPMGHAGFRLPI